MFSRSAAQAIRASVRRTPLAVARSTRYNSSSAGGSKGGNGVLYGVGAAGLAAGLGYYLYSQTNTAGERLDLQDSIKAAASGVLDYQAVYADIVHAMESEDAETYDDGSFGPVLVRLAWHASGTYDKLTNTGGSNGATMRFAPESDHGANAGLLKARDVLEKVHSKYPQLSYSDLWTLAGVAAIQEMSGGECRVPWRPGRQDRDAGFCSPDGRLPDGAKTQDHLRDIFHRMGFNDQDIVILSGAHALGRCHTDRSGFEGPWTHSPTVLTNDYYKLLLDEKWSWRKWNGPKQYEDKSSKSLMMLPSDMALIKDKSFRPHVEAYAKDQDLFYRDFSKAFSTLLELGVPFKDDAKPIELKPLASA